MVERSKKPSAIPLSPSVPTPRVEFTHDNERITATLTTGESVEILLYGATVISWKSHDRENLFLSEKSRLDGSKPVRGGIPLVFPLFGPPPSSGPLSSLSQHGFARNARWEFLNTSTSESERAPKSAADNSVTLDFGLSTANLGAEAQKAWPYHFSIIYSVRLGQDELETTILVRNEGQESFEFQALMHTYFGVKDISKTTVSGLQGGSYLDKVDSYKEKTESQAQVGIEGEVDRIYKSLDPKKAVTLLEDGQARFEITRDSLPDVVVWNPGPEKAGGMSDFGPSDGWKRMLCIEPGAVAGLQKLDPGDTFEGGQIIKSLT